VEFGNTQISVCGRCELFGLPRSTLYYRNRGMCERNLKLMRLIDEQYTRTPFYGSCRMAVWLNSCGHGMNRKRMNRLIRQAYTLAAQSIRSLRDSGKYDTK